MSQATHAPGQNLTRQKLAGVVFALTTPIPAWGLTKVFEPATMRTLPFSPWILLPVAGSAVSGFLLAPRQKSRGIIFGALAGFGSFWLSCAWAAGSRATSIYEILGTSFAGVLPSLLLHGIIFGRSSKATSGPAAVPAVPSPPVTVRLIVIGALAFTVLTIMAAYELGKLRHHTAGSVRIWAPIASFYDRFGYWPAILFTPCFGALVVAALFWRFRKQQREDQTLVTQNQASLR